ncbi:MerR family transcriptional regulator [Rhodobacteraceae bacterium D3-12]|nr:MerR family transcriptional regulator [Rhodobacteraceae bacterium D3-12]
MKLLDISQVSARSGFAASTLRYYEERGLIESLARKGLRRQYDSNVLDRLALITMGQSAGFSLDDIAVAFVGDDRFDLDRDLLLAQSDKLRAQVKQLSLLSDILEHVANCSAPSHSECPSFRRMMDAALSHPKNKSAKSRKSTAKS